MLEHGAHDIARIRPSSERNKNRALLWRISMRKKSGNHVLLHRLIIRTRSIYQFHVKRPRAGCPQRATAPAKILAPRSLSSRPSAVHRDPHAVCLQRAAVTWPGFGPTSFPLLPGCLSESRSLRRPSPRRRLGADRYSLKTSAESRRPLTPMAAQLNAEVS